MWFSFEIVFSENPNTEKPLSRPFAHHLCQQQRWCAHLRRKPTINSLKLR